MKVEVYVCACLVRCRVERMRKIDRREGEVGGSYGPRKYQEHPRDLEKKSCSKSWPKRVSCTSFVVVNFGPPTLL